MTSTRRARRDDQPSADRAPSGAARPSKPRDGGLRILYVGARDGTALQRGRALADLGHRVTWVESGPARTRRLHRGCYLLMSRIRRAPDVFLANRRILRWIARERFDLLWIDKGLSIAPSTLRRVRRSAPETRIVSYSPDDMLNPVHQSPRWLASVPLYDLHVTTKTYNVPELRQFGAADVCMVDNAYDPDTHRPMQLSEDERRHYAAEIGFIGHFERERADHVLALARAGLEVTVHGPAWGPLRGAHPNLRVGGSFLEGLDYTRAINATRINLGFLRKGNRDLQTTRSVEIPACGGFLLAERTDEHQRLFEEGREAEYFGSFEELRAKCRFYLEHEDERLRIAEAGRRRCLESGYSNAATLARVLAALADLRVRRGPAP